MRPNWREYLKTAPITTAENKVQTLRSFPWEKIILESGSSQVVEAFIPKFAQLANQNKVHSALEESLLCPEILPPHTSLSRFRSVSY